MSMALHGPVSAQDTMGTKLPQIAYLGANADAVLGSQESKDLLFLTLEDLPSPADAELQVFAALLRANPVTRLTTSVSADANFSDQLLLVADIALSGTAEAQTVTMGGTTRSMTEFADHTKALIGAINPTRRATAFIRVSDPQSLAPAAISGIRAMADALGFGLTVVTVVESDTLYGCQTSRGEAIPRDLISGVADRQPFGNGDGTSSLAEVETYVTDALRRHSDRSEACGAMYSFLINGQVSPEDALIVHTSAENVAAVESAVYHETFEAMFLQKASQEAELLDYLGNCEFCPLEAELNDRLTNMRRTAVERTLESQIWDVIKADQSPERLTIYLESCKYCEYREEAQQQIDDIALSAKYGQEEEQLWIAARDSRDPAEMRLYAETCKFCGFRDEAIAAAEQIERDETYTAEASLLATAFQSRDLNAAQSYLSTCIFCADRDEAEKWVALESRRAEVLGPCENLAGLPQTGGPRKLEDIDRFSARQACELALNEFPDDGVIATYLGRVDQASGDFQSAAAAYETGMKDAFPAAYGLSAYLRYAPGDGVQPNMREAEELALIGSEMGDWLSKELLTVLYAKQLISGRSPADAYQVARPNAEDGNPIAQYFVGFFYHSGTGVEASSEDAAQWFEKAVSQEFVQAYSFLADLLERGDGVEKDPVRAAELYWQAVQRGDETALTRLSVELPERTNDVVRIVQEKLREAGVYRGSVDGIPGPSTVRALSSYAESLTGSG